MKKIEIIIIFFLLTLIFIVFIFIILINKGYVDVNSYFNNLNSLNLENNENLNYKALDDENLKYEVYQNDNFINKFESYDEALNYAIKYKNSSIKIKGEEGFIYDSIPPFNVYIGDNEWFMAFESPSDAINYAKNYENSKIIHRKTNKVIWSNKTLNKTSFLIENVPLICQYPELFRGCEVTSLAMLLNYKGISISKMDLALEIKKDESKFKIINGLKYYGNPNFGFVGDIYSKEKSGLGVYHGPIYELLKSYIGDYALDLTNIYFEDLYYYINNNIPVWIITNTRFKELSENNFETWYTEQGEIKITYSEHSVLVIGYDENYIYYNDPMYSDKIYKKPKDDFIKAFEQMGSQAVTYYE